MRSRRTTKRSSERAANALRGTQASEQIRLLFVAEQVGEVWEAIPDRLQRGDAIVLAIVGVSDVDGGRARGAIRCRVYLSHFLGMRPGNQVDSQGAQDFHHRGELRLRITAECAIEILA